MDPRMLTLMHRWKGTQSDREFLQQAVTDGLDINEVDENGQNVLHRIARDRAREPDGLARVLVEFGADANCADVHGNLPLHYACAYADDSMFIVGGFNSFLEYADVNHANNAGERPLHWAQCATDDESAHIR